MYKDSTYINTLIQKVNIISTILLIFGPMFLLFILLLMVIFKPEPISIVLVILFGSLWVVGLASMRKVYMRRFILKIDIFEGGIKLSCKETTYNYQKDSFKKLYKSFKSYILITDDNRKFIIPRVTRKGLNYQDNIVVSKFSLILASIKISPESLPAKHLFLNMF